MLRTDFMPRSNDAPLEQAESGFNGISMNVAVGVMSRVVNRAMFGALHFIQREWIDGRFVRQNYFHMTTDVCIDDFAHGFRLGTFVWIAADRRSLADADLPS